MEGLQLERVPGHHKELRRADVAADDELFQRPKKSYPGRSTIASCLGNRVDGGVVDASGNGAVGQTEVSQSLAVLADCSQVTGVQPVEVVEGEAGESRGERE